MIEQYARVVRVDDGRLEVTVSALDPSRNLEIEAMLRFRRSPKADIGSRHFRGRHAGAEAPTNAAKGRIGYAGHAEVSELVQYLREPDTFSRLGAQIPRGVLLMGLYEIQIFDSWHGHLQQIYPDGQAASIYGQTPPMVNVCRPPGQ